MLKNIDIISINCNNPNGALMAIKHCQKYFQFGSATLFTHVDISDENVNTVKIPNISSVNDYSNFILQLVKYVNNEFVIIVQDDGFITNPKHWDDNFLNYDFIGAPWPSSEDKSWIELQKPELRPHLYNTLGKNRVGNGGFSLRSKKFLEFSSNFNDCNGIGEDAFLNIVKYNEAIKYGIKYPALDLALKFSHENAFIDDDKKIRNPNFVDFDINNHFGFHGHNFRNSNSLINLKFNQ